MNKMILTPLAALALSGCMTEGLDRMDARTDAALAEELRDYVVAGAPTSCVRQRDLRGNRSAGEGAIIFDGPGSLIYVNRPRGGCPMLGANRALLTRTPSTRLCEGDIATVFDPVSSLEYGGCGLGEFTPYRRRG